MTMFGNRFRALRLENGFTQDALADELGVSRSTIGMYEQGKREPNFEMLEHIADLFNVDMDFLLGTTAKTTKVLSDVPKALFEVTKRKRKLDNLLADATERDLDLMIFFAEQMFNKKETK